MNIFRKLALAVSVAALAVVIQAAPANAYSNENMIDNAVFDNKDAMNEAQIRAFILSRPNTCLARLGAGYGGGNVFYEPIDYWTYGPNTVDAARVVYKAAQYNGVNPRVILSTLQKEQSLITDNDCVDSQGFGTLRKAMGTGCPDNYRDSSGNIVCPKPDFVGFERQVMKGTWQLAHDRHRSEGDLSWGRPDLPYNYTMVEGERRRCSTSACPMTYYDGYGLVNGVLTKQANGATAALYVYTPYLNQSFSYWFEYFFGAGSTSAGFAVIKSADSPQQYVYESGKKRYIPSVSVKFAWNLVDEPVLEYSQAQIDAIPLRDDRALSNIARIDGSQAVYLVDNGKRYYISSLELMSSWGLNTAAIADVGVRLGSTLTPSSNLEYSVRSYDSNDQRIFMVDGGSLRPYASPDILRSWEGDAPSSITPSQDLFNSLGPIGTSVDSIKATNGGQNYLVVSQQRLPSSSSVNSLYPGTNAQVSASTVSRLRLSAGASWFVRANNSPTVYMIDGGSKHQVMDPNILLAWSPRGVPVVNIVSPAILETIPTGPAINQYVASNSNQLFLFTGQKLAVPTSLKSTYEGGVLGEYAASSALLSLYTDGPQATGFLRGVSTPTVYILDASTRRSVTDWNTFSLWNGSRGEPTTLVYDFVLNQFTKAANISYKVSSSGNEYVLDNGAYYQVNAGTKANWGLSDFTPVAQATLNRFTNGGILSSDIITNTKYYVVRSGSSYATVNPYIAEVWGVASAQIHSDLLLSAVRLAGPLQPFFATTSPADSRIFLKDTNGGYVLNSPSQVYNFGYINTPMPKLDVSEINSMTISASINNNIQHGTDYFLVDSGKRRQPADASSSSAWALTTSSSLVSTSLRNYLQSGQTVSRLVKGSGQAVYAIESGAKRWITSPTILSNNYQGVPVSLISDQLLSLIPTGSPY